MAQQKSDRPAAGTICFLSADPEAEHHELALAKDPAQKTHNVQQVSFKVQRLDDVRAFYHRLQAEGLRIGRTVTHGIACSVYFFDPEDNRVELYYTTLRGDDGAAARGAAARWFIGCQAARLNACGTEQSPQPVPRFPCPLTLALSLPGRGRTRSRYILLTLLCGAALSAAPAPRISPPPAV
jgi:hypothetical protein